MLDLVDIEITARERTLVRGSASVQAGEQVCLVAPSGAGKSSLLRVIAGLEQPLRGSVRINGTALPDSAAQRDRFRANNVGIVFQRSPLLPALDVLSNLLIAAHLAGTSRGAEERARELLARVDLAHLAGARTNTLSGGEAQRVGIARALMNRPKLLLADEPTASLDRTHAEAALSLLREMALAENAVLVLATHDERVIPHFRQHWSLPGLGKA